MLLRLSILMIVVPLLELALLFQINKYVGLIPTIGIVVVTGFLGASLARYQGRNAWQNVQLAMKQGRMPSTEISEGILIFVAGLLLITPGLITDTTGFLLLVPVFRRRVARALQAWFRKNATVQFHSAASAFTSASAPFETYSDIETTDAQRPSVRVVDPSQGKLSDDT
ncbi:MAG: FxsA family protein [Planctomyces sp.]|nr:FxsA family protein [Planctomyces sp.]